MDRSTSGHACESGTRWNRYVFDAGPDMRLALHEPLLGVLDRNRVTEDGAEAVALTYVNSKAGWVVKRRMNRGESADWLLTTGTRSLALEVSGTTETNPLPRLREKRQQVGHCTLADDYPVDRLAVVVAFSGPMILAGLP